MVPGTKGTGNRKVTVPVLFGADLVDMCPGRTGTEYYEKAYQLRIEGKISQGSS